MGSNRESGAARQPGSIPETSRQILNFSQSSVAEVPVAGTIPRLEIPGWRDRYRVIAGITARGSESGRGFDLGLWSSEPVGEVMGRWLALRREMGEFPSVVLGNQVHGTEVMSVHGGRGWVYVDGIDGWITTTPGTLLAVTVADCIPVYLVAPGLGIALLHAGWKGVAGGILERGIARLLEVTGSNASQVVMHCGVGICGSCYEVGSEVMTGCGLPAEGAGPWRIDLRARLLSRAHELGLRAVSSSSWCSAHHRPEFYSHRASKGSDGRMVAYLGMSPGHAVVGNERLAPKPLRE
jgi:YfiH family protein